jgi:deoxyribonuclease V
MRQELLHRWDVAPQEAIEIQRRLRSAVILEPCDVSRIKLVAGADVSFDKDSDKIFAAVVVLELPDLNVVAKSGVMDVATFPYIPGLLSFREAPAVLKAWEKLERGPDALMLDGQGLAHPRRFGLACHLGLWVDIPSVGCAKSLLVGNYEEPSPEAGSHTPLVDKSEVVGVALRTKDRTNPMFISPGHRVDLESAMALVMRCVKGYRQPEPTRQAHLYVNQLRRGETEEDTTGWLF